MKSIRDSKIYNLCVYISAFVFSVLIAVILLILTSYVPQDKIINNLWHSHGMIYAEGQYPSSSDYSAASILDNFSDIYMLRETAAMEHDHISTIMTNPLYHYENADSIGDLTNYINGETHDSVSYYVRYWMGFRAVLRIALAFLNYFQIRRYLAVLFFCLFSGVMCSIAKHCGTQLAFLFSISVIFVRPYIIVDSLQYSNCFIIMFLAMLLIPWICRHPKWEKLFFMEVGIITMYFDFYTVPLITMGFPLIYLILLHVTENRSYPVRSVLAISCMWFSGYVMMWIAKLVLTSMLTSIDAVSNGIHSMFGRIGIEKVETEGAYSIFYAFDKLKDVLLIDSAGRVAFVMLCCIVLLVAIISITRKQYSSNMTKMVMPIMIIAAFPFIWFSCTAQPISVHYYFQYRTISLTYWGVLSSFWLVFLGSPANKQMTVKK